jgi:chromosome segregation protein
MHLQSLELLGFKSFADKTTFNFHEGITAIVGPNGCGKSNLLDATRWVLGEQSAKSLRGGEMADVIFNGTDSRKPLGFAEVSLTLTDCTAELGVEWHDVRVSRRIYRDGNSEYFLNKTLCRLRDIQNLFADTGVARAAYSMMEQGKIDLLLSSRPEDRRAVFEEAAGITKYKVQKREALRKLEATEANLLRIGDVIKEVKRQIGSLQRQAGKARRYQALLADLQVLDTHQSRKRFEALEGELAQCRADISHITDEEAAIRAKIDAQEIELQARRHALDQLDTEIAEGRTELERLQSEITGHRNRIDFNRQRADEIAELIARSKAEIAAAEAKRDEQQGQIKELSSLLESTSQLLEGKRAQLAQLTEYSSKIQSDRHACETQLDGLRVALAKAESRTTALEDEISGITIRRGATTERLRELDSLIEAARIASAKAANALAEARDASQGEERNVENLLAQTRSAEEALRRHRELLSEVEEAATVTERSLAEKESRLDVLKQLNEEGEGLAQGSQAVLKGLDDPSRIQSALAGALVANLDVDPTFVPAIEAALGRNLHTIILQQPEVAPEIFATLTQKQLGQTALYVPGLAEFSSPEPRVALPPDALGFADEKVSAPESLQPLLRRLLHNTVIFTDLNQAISFKRTIPEFSVATLTGEFISAAGIIFGGSNSGQKESLLERKARISMLTAEHSALTAQRETLRAKREEARTSVAAAERHLEETRSQYHAADLARSALGNSIAALQRESEETLRKLESLMSEKTILGQQMQAADIRLTDLEKELATARDEIFKQKREQTDSENRRQVAVAEHEKTAEHLNELRLEIATEQQRHDSLIAQQRPMTNRDAELVEVIESRRADITRFEERLAAQAGESRSAEAAIERETARRQERREQLAAAVERRAGSLSALNAAELELRGIRNSVNELRDRRSAQQVRESQLVMTIANLTEKIQNRYHIDLRSFAADQLAFEKVLQLQRKRAEKAEEATVPMPSPGELGSPELEKIIADLNQQLDNMGPVNLDAVHEYDQLEERYRFLEAQNEDLTKSRRELLDVIARINSTTEKLFAETFAQVRANFREMFAELFGGGRADLSLLDENDSLNCGIEISAKPPGKQLQTISLLSGGERSMTAVALLFAIYMVRPSPFCVLDEMDAALDETNINRFIRVLERFATESQFIIITHNKHTIAKADILYGVTMEERGVSKLVGMKLTERTGVSAGSPSQARPAATQREFAMAENGDAEHKASFAAR